MKGKGKSKGVRVKMELESESSFTVAGNAASCNIIRECSNFSAVLQRRDIKNLRMDDLRAVQFELEDQFISAVRRRKQLENKIFSLETLHSKKDKRSRSTDSIEKKNSDERPPKKSKESSSKAHSASSSNHHKSKYIPPDPYQEIPKPAKNDAPSRFWSFVEPYCADVTQDMIRTIEEWIIPQESDEKYQKIPELGEHFSKTWPFEDLKEEIMEGSKSAENNKGLFSDSAQDRAEIERILKLGENEGSSMDDDNEPSLLDKIVYSLVGENLMTRVVDAMNEDCNGEGVLRREPNFVQVSTLANNNLEERLYAAFVNAGLLEPDEEKIKTDDDEICQELKKLQGALVPVHEYNIIQKKKLLALTKAELVKLEVKKKLQEYDAKVMEVYRSVATAKRNKTMNKKLEDQIKRTLRERKKLVEKLSKLQ
ncbi:transcriptional adapter 3 [Nephila pilipes]|uniref:Transcriptional adapter 3 n=1 Tax=Nephila pilipes TaxID=299642 RepID=A0A8X6TEX4_NEPPI|nr:transcriptional adapter 3 [Nephila pilipes]